ncbi:MAG: DegV family EDD domain-containing protein [Anaerolineales bacterium]|nr:DegV family EDD domain-containing protein [Anaerolineales bacterium]
MHRVCILTDNTAQFPSDTFPGQELVHTIPLAIEWNGRQHFNSECLKLVDMPDTAANGQQPILKPPCCQVLRKLAQSLCSRSHEAIAILSTCYLTPGVTFVEGLAETVRGQAAIRVIDSHTTSIGLGLIVQQAALAAAQGMPATEIVHQLNEIIPRVYTLFFTQNMSYLYPAGILDPGQALTGEMLRIMPLMILENGQPIFTCKIRSARHLTDVLHDFIIEFIDPEYIGLIQGRHSYRSAIRNLMSRLFNVYPYTVFKQSELSPLLATIFGPGSFGLVVLERKT